MITHEAATYAGEIDPREIGTIISPESRDYIASASINTKKES